jgi:hypothetical protein
MSRWDRLEVCMCVVLKPTSNSTLDPPSRRECPARSVNRRVQGYREPSLAGIDSSLVAPRCCLLCPNAPLIHLTSLARLASVICRCRISSSLRPSWIGDLVEIVEVCREQKLARDTNLIRPRCPVLVADSDGVGQLRPMLADQVDVTVWSFELDPSLHSYNIVQASTDITSPQWQRSSRPLPPRSAQRGVSSWSRSRVQARSFPSR